VINLGPRAQVHASLAWLLDATAKTHPKLKPCYRLDGGSLSGRQRTLKLSGFSWLAAGNDR
jgi:hypothetical protein